MTDGPERISTAQLRGLARSLHGVAMDADDEQDASICREASAAMIDFADALEAANARIRELEASYDDQKWKRYAAEMELAHTASARAEALEEAARVLDQHESVPCKPAFPEVWSDEAINRYESGQIDAAISWQAAIRALKGGSNE